MLFKCTATIPLSFFLLRVRSRLTRQLLSLTVMLYTMQKVNTL
nr:MAG TPA_asm: hypothetical protein [Caudoviricetes sp.]